MKYGVLQAGTRLLYLYFDIMSGFVLEGIADHFRFPLRLSSPASLSFSHFFFFFFLFFRARAF